MTRDDILALQTAIVRCSPADHAAVARALRMLAVQLELDGKHDLANRLRLRLLALFADGNVQ